MRVPAPVAQLASPPLQLLLPRVLDGVAANPLLRRGVRALHCLTSLRGGDLALELVYEACPSARKVSDSDNSKDARERIMDKVPKTNRDFA